VILWLEALASRWIEREDGADWRNPLEWVRLAVGYVIVCFLGLYELGRALLRKGGRR